MPVPHKTGAVYPWDLYFTHYVATNPTGGNVGALNGPLLDIEMAASTGTPLEALRSFAYEHTVNGPTLAVWSTSGGADTLLVGDRFQTEVSTILVSSDLGAHNHVITRNPAGVIYVVGYGIIPSISTTVPVWRVWEDGGVDGSGGWTEVLNVGSGWSTGTRGMSRPVWVSNTEMVIQATNIGISTAEAQRVFRLNVSAGTVTQLLSQTTSGSSRNGGMVNRGGGLLEAFALQNSITPVIRRASSTNGGATWTSAALTGFAGTDIEVEPLVTSDRWTVFVHSNGTVSNANQFRVSATPDNTNGSSGQLYSAPGWSVLYPNPTTLNHAGAILLEAGTRYAVFKDNGLIATQGPSRQGWHVGVNDVRASGAP